MNFFAIETDGVFVMPKSVIGYLKNAKKSEAKLIMYLFALQGENFDIEKCAKDLCETKESINAALSFWRGTGVISQRDDGEIKTAVPQKKQEIQAPKEETYTTSDVADALKNDAEFKELVSFAEHILGTLLNSAKVAKLLYLYDNLGMQADVIMGIIAHCVSEDKKSIRYIEKCAQGIHEDGVVTYKELETYLAQKRRYKSFEGKVKNIIGAQDRALTSKEKSLIKMWESQYKSDISLVEYAYEMTISAISKPSVSYMSKILESWSLEGIDTVEKAMQKKSERQENQNSDVSEIDFEDIFEKP